MTEPTKPSDDSEPAQAHASGSALGRAAPALWVLAGVAATLLVVLLVGPGRGDESEARRAAASSRQAASRPQPLPLSSARARFAELYLNYLIHSYYTGSRGFCKPLLRKVCEALLSAELLSDPAACNTLPNDAFILAIGRYQHRVGLPVDGKAGPETVRMMVGGDFSNRRGMAAMYCGPPPEDGGGALDDAAER